MTPDHPQLPENLLFQADGLKPGPEREALMMAKVRQDESHAKFNSWIAVAIAELTE